MIITQDEACLALEKIGVQTGSLFFEVFSIVRNFTIGVGEELNTLDQIVKSSQDSFWNDEFPGFSEKYLELSSIEGEGSYFYCKSLDSVYDVGWDEMKAFVEGEVEPSWLSFDVFLAWYYNIS